MKKTLLITFCMILALLPTACSSHDDEPVDTLPVRTVLVYMAANNSLGLCDYDKSDLSEMRTAALRGQLGNARWLVYHHPYNGEASLLELTADGEFRTLVEYTDGKLSVSQERMSRVLDDTRRLAPAADYGLVLWSHASGWLENGITESRQRSFGIDNGRYMNITTLAETIKPMGFSFIYADCCNMACVEVAYQLRDCADYFVASAAELPAKGMDYSLNMGLLTSPQPDLIGAARNTFNIYAPFNDQRGNSWCTMSVIYLPMMEELARATDAIYRSGSFPKNFEPQSFTGGYNYYSDLTQFVEQTASQPELFENWKSVMNRTVLYQAATPYITGAIPVKTHCGLTTYIQNSKSDNTMRNYNRLDWYNDVACHQPLP
ncbi:MAG: hypothetical protein K2O00_06425 [Muribaculaceae bacterium]|nr:hypothetical protein [Muribaculaceae bacterium]